MHWLYLLIAGLVYVASVLVSYHGDFKRTTWYVPASLLLGSSSGLLWFLAVRDLQENRDVYVYSFCWDAMMYLVFWGLPVLFLGVRISGQGVFAAGLVIAGLVLLQRGA
jgi:multidrug transporter EmrE-like cation transporter